MGGAGGPAGGGPLRVWRRRWCCGCACPGARAACVRPATCGGGRFLWRLTILGAVGSGYRAALRRVVCCGKRRRMSDVAVERVCTGVGGATVPRPRVCGGATRWPRGPFGTRVLPGARRRRPGVAGGAELSSLLSLFGGLSTSWSCLCRRKSSFCFRLALRPALCRHHRVFAP